MATKSGSGTTGSGTPWTAQQFSAWKRREKGRLVKARTALSGNSLGGLSDAKLKVQIEKAKEEVRTLTKSITGLNKQSRGAAISSFRQRETDLIRRSSALETEIQTRFFTGGLRGQRDELQTRLKQVQAQHARERKVVSAKARKKLPETRASLKKAEQRLSLLTKLQKTVKDLGLTNSQGPLVEVVDKLLAGLDKDPHPPWVVAGVTAYAKEQTSKAREAVKKATDNRKQLEKDSKDLAGLQGSEAAISKRIEALERRLEREKERVLAERKFIYKKLNNKRSVHPGLTQRERNFWYEHSNVRDLGNKDWATKGVEFSAKLRTSARKIEELKADIKELKAGPEKIRVLKSSIRKLEKDIATADKANAAAGGWPKGKAPRIGYIANAHAFEKYMAEWMRWLGWDNAKAMPVGPDEGIDVKATGALGQAKHWDTEVGIEEVQRHNGVCEGIQKYGRVFLSKSGYTPQAIKWANDRDLPLFEMKAGDKDAGVVASTKAGEKLLKVGAKAMKGNKRN
jgi:hypothetical protein